MSVSLEDRLSDSSKYTIDLVSKEVGGDEKQFADLLELAYLQKPSVSARAGRAAYQVAMNHPWIFDKHKNKLINTLPTLDNESVQFVLAKILVDAPLTNDEDSLGILMDYCFENATAVKTKIALKAYCYYILYNISEVVPEIKPELKMVIEEQLPFASAGIKSISYKLLKKLNKDSRQRIN